MLSFAHIPMRNIGPILIQTWAEKISVPLATFESPVWAAVNRGARVSRHTSGIEVVVVQECMTRSIILEAIHLKEALNFLSWLDKEKETLKKKAESTSQFIQFKNFQSQLVGNLIYVRFEFLTGNAAGHNMTTKAAQVLMDWIIAAYQKEKGLIKVISVSGNYCTDKKVSAVNGILGRGKYVIAEMIIPKKICEKLLDTSPDAIVELNQKKNWMGSTLAGSVRSANAHFANMLLAFYLATGQDAANIIEGSQGFTYAALKNEELYFSVTLPNIIVGTVGAGKNFDFVKENLKQMDCDETTGKNKGDSSRRLAMIAAAVVCCGELSLLAALTKNGELVRSHLAMERNIKLNF